MFDGWQKLAGLGRNSQFGADGSVVQWTYADAEDRFVQLADGQAARRQGKECQAMDEAATGAELARTYLRPRTLAADVAAMDLESLTRLVEDRRSKELSSGAGKAAGRH